MNDDQSTIHQQYLMLREASWKRMEAQRNISVFTVTAVLAYFAFVVDIAQERPYLYLLPILIILPLAFKELDNKVAISYIVAYQIAFLEDIKECKNGFTWETDFLRFKSNGYNKVVPKIVSVLADCEFIIMSVVSYLLYSVFAWGVIDKNNFWSAGNLLNYGLAIIFLIILAVIFYVTFKYNTYTKFVTKYVEQWLEYMLDTERIDKQTYKRKIKELKKFH